MNRYCDVVLPCVRSSLTETNVAIPGDPSNVLDDTRQHLRLMSSRWMSHTITHVVKEEVVQYPVLAFQEAVSADVAKVGGGNEVWMLLLPLFSGFEMIRDLRTTTDSRCLSIMCVVLVRMALA